MLVSINLISKRAKKQKLEVFYFNAVFLFALPLQEERFSSPFLGESEPEGQVMQDVSP